MFESRILDNLIPMAFGFASSFVLTWMGSRFFNVLRVYSKTSFRRIKSSQVPLLGGMAIYLSLISGVLWLPNGGFLTVFLISALPLVIVGVMDDFLELRARWKFIGQIFSTILFLYLIPPPAFVFFQLGYPIWLSYPLMAFLILSLCNAVNFVDGIDGLASSLCLFSLIGIIFLASSPVSAPLLCIGSVGGFYAFNRAPAKIYLGDAGSGLLGFLMGCYGMTAKVSTVPSLTLVAILFLFAPVLMETLTSILRRLKKGVSPVSADVEHLHHILLRIGFSETQTVALNAGIAACCTLTAIILFFIETEWLGWTIAGMSTFLLITVLGLIKYGEYSLGRFSSRIGYSIFQTELIVNAPFQLKYKEFKTILFDLLPYYKDLQAKGVSDLNHFAHDMLQFIKFDLPQGQMALIGTHHILIVLPGEENWKQEETKILEEKYYKMTARFGLVKNDFRKPEGMFFIEAQNSGNFKALFNNPNIKSAEFPSVAA